MIELHVWGTDSNISIISPECVASAWLLRLCCFPQEIPFQVVPSSNTNLADSNKLPVMIIRESPRSSIVQKYEGYLHIVEYISKEIVPKGRDIGLEFILDTYLADSLLQLANKGLVSYLENSLSIINEFNLFINNNNYEGYTRKLFQNYLPFPMMYNEPLKLSQLAKANCESKGLYSSTNFLGFRSFKDVPQTEHLNVESTEEQEADPVALSGLHERQLMSKVKKRQLYHESSQSLNCLIETENYMDKIISLFELLGNLNHQLNIFSKNDTKANLFCSSELFLYALLYCMCHHDIPDKFIFDYINVKYTEITKKLFFKASYLNNLLYTTPNIFRKPRGSEVPSLWNEIKYLSGYVL